MVHFFFRPFRGPPFFFGYVSHVCLIFPRFDFTLNVYYSPSSARPELSLLGTCRRSFVGFEPEPLVTVVDAKTIFRSAVSMSPVRISSICCGPRPSTSHSHTVAPTPRAHAVPLSASSADLYFAETLERRVCNFLPPAHRVRCVQARGS